MSVLNTYSSALQRLKNGVAAKALEELGLVTEDIFEAVEEHVGRGNKKATVNIYDTSC